MGLFSAPKNKGLNRAAQANAKLAKESFEWFKAEYAATAPERAAAEERANAISDAQLAQMQEQTRIAKDYDEYNRGTFRPLEQRIVAESQAYDTPERRAAAATEAAADVQIASDNQQGILSRNLSRSGVNPSSMQSIALNNQNALSTAAASAGAQNRARKNVEAVGAAKMMDAASLGRGLPSAQATAVQTGIQAGNASLGAKQASLDNTYSGSNLMSRGFNTAIAANQSAGNLYAQQPTGGLGQVLGDIAGQWAGSGFQTSDINVKTKTGKVADGAKMLDQIEQTEVQDGWEYDPAKGGPDDGGVPHTGPMAQQVRKTMGEETAPGGKAIDLVSMNGKMMAAIQELSKRIKKLEKEDATEMEAA